MDEARYEEIVASLRRDGGRVTATRKAVVRALLDSDDHHLTAAAVTGAVRDLDPEFQESTVYRTLDRLAELGIVEHIHIGSGAAVYHLSDADHRHHHLVCDRCGRVVEVPPGLLDSVARRVERDHGFVLDAGHFALSGTCAACRSRGR
ncbi:MAG TPA: Fur family transcriptional regulator [Acidimicrobiales bacterium]|nr:Fur family transcriptional regulator [Acidimicrobiales bacterium]